MKKVVLQQLTELNYNGIKTIRVIFATVAIGIGVTNNSFDPSHEHGKVTINKSEGQVVMVILQKLYYNGTDIVLNKPGLTDEMREYCLLSIDCMRKYIMNYLNSDTSRLNHYDCCSDCLSCCQCFECVDEV